MDAFVQKDIEQRLLVVYGHTRYARLTPACKALFVAACASDWRLLDLLYRHLSPRNVAMLSSLHRDLIDCLVHIDTHGRIVATTRTLPWLGRLLAAWYDAQWNDAVDILTENEPHIDSFSVTWLLALKTKIVTL